MKIKIHSIFVLFILISSIFIFSSCHEKGCMDKNAINYNSVADVDDGSCIICKQSIETLAIDSVFLVDQNFSSIHYNDTVATFVVTQVKNKFTYSECGSNSCYFRLKIRSRIVENMNFDYSLQSSGDVSFNFQRFVVVPTHATISDSIPSNNVNNPCGNLLTGFLFLNNFSTINYN